MGKIIKTGVKVFAPASVGNIACGFDVLGFALNGPGDEVLAKPSNTKGITISKIIGAKGKLPYDPSKNTASVAAMAVLKLLGREDVGVDLEIRKKMPFGSGLGSSAASAVAGAMAINELFRRPLEKKDLLQCALLGEQLSSEGARNIDNIAPSLFGGMVYTRHTPTLESHRLFIPKSLQASVVHPHIKILTKDARGILSEYVKFEDAVLQTRNMGGLIVGLYNNNFELIKSSLTDVLVEPQRAKLIPHFYKVKEAAMNAGALGCSISGAGPSIFAISMNTFVAENVGNAMQKVFTDNKIDNTLYLSPINQQGAILM